MGERWNRSGVRRWKSWLVLGVSGGQGRRSAAEVRRGGVLAVQQEVEVDLVEGLGVLVLGPVTAVLHHRELRAGDQRGDPLRLGDRPRRVLGGPQDQSGSL